MGIEVGAVAFFGAEEEGDTIMGADGDEGDVAGTDALEAVAAEAVAEEDGVAGWRGAVNGGLERLAEDVRGIVEALREEVECAGVGGEGGEVAEFAPEDVTGDDVQMFHTS